MVLLNDGDPQSVNHIANRILASMPTSVTFKLDADKPETVQDLPVTISIGISTIESHDDPQLAFQKADQALYQVKHDGKARSVWASVSADPITP